MLRLDAVLNVPVRESEPPQEAVMHERLPLAGDIGVRIEDSVAVLREHKHPIMQLAT